MAKKRSSKASTNTNSKDIPLFLRVVAVIIGVSFIATGNAKGNEIATKIAVLGWLSTFLLIAFRLVFSIGIKNFIEKIKSVVHSIKSKLDKLGGKNKLSVISSKIVNKNNEPMAPGLPPLSVLPAPPLAVQRAEQERTGKGYANRVNAAFRRCGLLKKGETLEIHDIQTGPGSVRITVRLLEGMRITQVTAMGENLANSFGVTSIQIEDGAWAGTAALIIPFVNRLPVYLKTIMITKDFVDFQDKAELPIVLGCNDTWQPIMLDLVKVKHLLIAGATGAGKSFCLNTMITTLLMCTPPEKVKFIFIDPKMVELAPYTNFPHTLQVAINTEDALKALDQLTKEMDHRFDLFTKHKVKNIQHYWKKTGDKSMNYIVIVIDELADLMLVSKQVAKKQKKESEEAISGAEYSIQRLTQKARAAGIHLIVATQRPDVKVVTGTIKSNLPSRISFYLLSQHDYRTVLDEAPSFDLMGQGDGLAIIEGHRGRIRFQGACVALTDAQIEKTIIDLENFWNPHNHRPVTESKGQPKKEKVTQLEEDEKLLPASDHALGNSPTPNNHIEKSDQTKTDSSLSKGPVVKFGDSASEINPSGEMALLPDLLTFENDTENNEDSATANNNKDREEISVAKKESLSSSEVEPEDPLNSVEIKQLKQLIAECWFDQVNKNVPSDQIKAPSIRMARSILKVKQDTVLQLYNELVDQNWLQYPTAPRRPFMIVPNEEEFKAYFPKLLLPNSVTQLCYPDCYPTQKYEKSL